MYQLVLGILYFTIIGLISLCWVVLRKWSGRLHGFMFFSCVANLIYNLGCLLEFKARSEEAYLMALKIGYFGRIWIGFALFLFATELCDIRVPEIVNALIVLIHLAVYASILTLESNTLYYKTMEVSFDGEIPVRMHTSGPLYYVQTGLCILYILA